jgi:hypothetical protein
MTSLLLILFVIWLLVLFGAVLIFGFIVPFSYFSNIFLNSVLKGIFATVLALVWLYIFVFLTRSFVRRHITGVGVSEKIENP